MDVLGDADHHATRRRAVVEHDALPDRVLARPHRLGHPLTHDRDQLAVRAIGSR